MSGSQEARKQLILDKLREKPLTCEQLTGELEMNYHTIYKSLRELQEAGLVHYTGRVVGKSFVWASGTNNGVPEFYDPAGNRKIPVDDIVAAFGQSRTAASIKAAYAFFETLEQLLNIANDTSEVSAKDLQAIRHRTIVNRSFIKNLDGYYQQLLANADFWDVEKLAVVGMLLKEKHAPHTSETTNLGDLQ